MIVSEFLQRLQKVKQTKPNHWECCCPAHSDQKASLCVSTGNDGRILVKCQAFCETEAVVAAMGLKMLDLFPTKESEAPFVAPKICATYDYTDAGGKFIFQVVKYTPKKFRQRRKAEDGSWIWNMDGVKRELFRLPKIMTAVKEGKDIWINEGEKGSLAGEAVGLETTNAPGGAGKWYPEYNDTLKLNYCLYNDTFILL